MGNDVEPLAPELWFERIGVIARRELRSTENALRHALHLLQLSPREFRPPNHVQIDEAEYEALLEAGELNTAARWLVDAPTLSVRTSTSEGGVKVAVRCSTLNLTMIGEGASEADAILQAWSKCLLKLKGDEPNWLRANQL